MGHLKDTACPPQLESCPASEYAKAFWLRVRPVALDAYWSEDLVASTRADVGGAYLTRTDWWIPEQRVKPGAEAPARAPEEFGESVVQLAVWWDVEGGLGSHFAFNRTGLHALVRPRV